VTGQSECCWPALRRCEFEASPKADTCGRFFMLFTFVVFD